MTTDLTENLDLHGERAALRGNPSFVWRAGQDRRLGMILQWAKPNEPQTLGRVLVDGCGVGSYVKALQPYAEQVYGIDIEPEHLARAVANAPQAALQIAAGEHLPYPANYFDLILSHEVLEHVQDDSLAAAEIARTLKPGGRAVIFVPNRLYPFETHGHYWQGVYHFGNTPLINYLPDGLRNRLAPHVRVYSRRDLEKLFAELPVRVVERTVIFGAYDNIIARAPALGRLLRALLQFMERTPLRALGLSHFWVVEKK